VPFAHLANGPKNSHKIWLKSRLCKITIPFHCKS